MVEAVSAPKNLLTDLHERLDDPDIEDELVTLRVGDVLIGLCDELDIPVDPSVWQGKGWFTVEEREPPEPPPAQPRKGDDLPYHEWIRQRYHTPPDG